MASSSKQPQGRDKTGKVEVTILAPEWGSSKGGLSTVIRELAIQLAKFPFVQVTLFLPKCSHKNKDEAEHHGISIVEAERQPGYEELDWLSFPPEDLQIDVVVGHGVKLGRQAPIIRKYHKCKWVQVVHTDPEELGMFKSYENPISKGEQKHYVEVELCQMADLVVAVGPKLTEAFRKYLGCCKNDQDVFEFIPGIFADFATVKQVPAKGKHRSVLVFGCGDAKDFELNGFDMAARSVAALPHSHLVVVGVPEGKHREFTERFIGLGVPANRLIVKDYKDREALKRLFCEVDLMLVASRTEGFDLIGVEALSAGLPVIVSKNSWFGEALGSIPFGSSFVIDSEDPSVWTAAIKGIWNKDRQVQLDESKILHDCYGKKYSWSEQCKNLLEKVVNLLENEPVAIKEMNKEKKKQHIKEMEKRSSAEEIDMTEVYTDKPVQEQVPDQAEEVPVEDTTQTQHEETTGDALSDDETWEDKEVANKEMKTEKQKQHIKEIEKPYSTEEVYVMETYTDRPVRGQFSGPLSQNIVMHSVPGHMPGPQAQPRHPTQPFYHGQRPMHIPRVTPQGNQPVYSSPPGGQMVPMLTHTGGQQFISQGQPNQFISQHVDFPVPVGAIARYPPPQAIQGQFPPVPGPSQPQGPLLYQLPTGFPMGQPPVYILRAPTPGMSQFQQQTIEPPTLEKKIIQIKDVNSNKDVAQEILKQEPAGSSRSTTAETPNVTPNLSGQSSNSSTPPLTSQQHAEANVQAQSASQVAATLMKNSEEKPKKNACLPDLEDASDARADGAKLTYGRDFLLQFQTNPLSMMKPEGLPDIDVVLVQARPPSKSGSQQNRMPKGNGGENMFLPSFMRQMSKGNPSGSRSGRNRNVTTKKVIELPSMQQQPDLKRVDNRWVRPSEVTKGGNEEEAKTQELFRKVRGILNKLTPQKFQTLTQQIIDLDIDTQERLEGAIDLIFAKAIDEATFSVAYAKMCQFLVSENKKVVVEKDGVKKDISFRKILLNRCQKEFEKENSIEKTINEKLADLVNQGLNEEELQKRKSDLEDQVHQAKRRTLGNIRFIGELFKLKMLTESIMHDCVVKLLRSNDEESFECLCKLLVTIGKDLDHEKGKPRVDQYFTQINKIISAKITSSRVRRMMQDIVDLRNNNWVPRREDNNLKTIDQIHKEAADQAKKTQIKIQMAKQERKLQRGGRGYGFWARGSSDGTGAVAADAGPSVNFSAVPELTKETMKKKTLSIIDEFLYIKDMKEVAECLKEIGSPSRHHVFVEVTFNHTMEKRTSERQLTGKLIHFLLRDGVLTSQEYLDGLNSVFEVAEDTEIDIPQLWKYLGELMGPSAFDGNLGLDVVFKCVFQHVQKHKAARLFACMLQSCEKSPEDVRAFLRAHNINLNIFFDDAEEAREFAKDKNIEYALGPASPSANQYSAKVEEELRNIILKRKARNEEVMDWIDENVSPSSKKGASFIRALVTVVCEIALEEEGEVCKCNIHKLKDRKNLLQKYIDANTDLEVQALYAVQALFLRLGRPQGFIKSYFDSLFDEEIITEVSFNTWESSVEEEPGKGVTVMAASEFFRWLRSATEDIDQEI
ncbi:eukaryotic translation initiation factor 4 gamma 3-like isoform X2 [Acropora millepora]|uniref:eukaryotic translation initiation factor 4 gamma 3-like isoform X2 n=1 Tax=Acropora millepora TaxID=45264 RepID=UPI001CF2AEF6|nr:eukaryotic translation initiation factor 4 gamma 3-like isoform X2 [Acropora millepora]